MDRDEVLEIVKKAKENGELADLRWANLTGANLRSADGNFSIGYFGKHHAVAAGGYISIGCERHTYFLTREQAIELAGLENVIKVEALDCEPTGAAGYWLTEWSAGLVLDSGHVLTAYYYTTKEQDLIMAEHDGDGTYIEWVVDHYEVI